ncbi:transcriptional regulator [Luteimonas saliphila]|uniref:transcriptional regulator n=1 Tax=Luteimonas saliphila TaxID=2804919 RepID=UPI00192D8A1D|nr:helix-turn-helix domain-containing protein [Luteimonas saliphila]
MDTPTALDRAIAAVGTQQALADALGIRSPSITEWKNRAVPAERCRAIEQATGGQVTVHDLRPDVFGPAPAANDQAVAEPEAEGDSRIEPFEAPP